jgi:hypothetical protein
MWLTVLTPANHWAEGFTNRPVEKHNTRNPGALSSEHSFFLKPVAHPDSSEGASHESNAKISAPHR